MSTAGADDDVPPPRVPREYVDGWEPVERSVERLFGVEGADVRGHTVVYEDRQLRRAVREATDGDVDQLWRFCFATRLAFRPPLAPGVAPLILPSVRRHATRAFCDDLRERGVETVETGRRERVRTDDRRRRRIRQVTGTVTTAAGTVTIEGWICVFHDEDIYMAGGAYPRSSLAEALALDETAETDGHPLQRDPAADRDHLLDFVTAVG